MINSTIIAGGWQGFLELCRKADSPESLNQLLEVFLTIEEREQIATRVLLVKELLKGEKTQRQIAKDLNISIAKITRGSNGLKTLSDDLKRLLRTQLIE